MAAITICSDFGAQKNKSLTLFPLFHIMQNSRLDKAQAGIKIARIDINNPRYADDPTLMAGSEEELKSFLMRVKEESVKVGFQHSKN